MGTDGHRLALSDLVWCPPVQVRLGDFGQFTFIRQPSVGREFSYNAPLGCGGAGTVMSRAAAQEVDFRTCAKRHAAICTQSDWAIATCMAESAVMPLLDHSCGVCAHMCGPNGFAIIESAIRKLENAKEHADRGSCAFVQITHECSSIPPRLYDKLLHTVRAGKAAVAHLDAAFIDISTSWHKRMAAGAAPAASSAAVASESAATAAVAATGMATSSHGDAKAPPMTAWALTAAAECSNADEVGAEAGYLLPLGFKRPLADQLRIFLENLHLAQLTGRVLVLLGFLQQVPPPLRAHEHHGWPVITPDGH